MSLQLGIAYADHEKGSSAALAFETRTLNDYVQNSSLRYNVKEAVYRFNYDVMNLVQCVRYQGVNSATNDHTDKPGIPMACEYNFRIAQDSFRPVERYLYDTSFDYPGVYQAFLEVKYSLYSIIVTN